MSDYTITTILRGEPCKAQKTYHTTSRPGQKLSWRSSIYASSALTTVQVFSTHRRLSRDAAEESQASDPDFF